MAVKDPCSSLANADVSFDLGMKAKHVQLSKSSVFAASMLICSRGLVDLDEGVSLDASGRGCAPGEGSGHGETRADIVKCGAGGGSHIGRGGEGAKYGNLSNPNQVVPCAM